MDRRALRSRRAVQALAILVTVWLFSWAGLHAANWLWPLDTSRAERLGVLVTDRNDVPLRVFASPDGYLRLPVDGDRLDPLMVEVLLAYEDRRFYAHGGTDYLAAARSLYLWWRHGRIVSGASTITMQTARLLHPIRHTALGKVEQMFRAWQLERRFTKAEILQLYFTVAPYGGSLEGITAASLYYFGHPPNQLTHAEAALLTVLPQAPTSNRPDRHPARARAARDKVLRRAADYLHWPPADLSAALAEPMHTAPSGLPFSAPQLAARLAAGTRRQTPLPAVRACIDAPTQSAVARQVRSTVRALPAPVSAAAVVVDNQSAEVLAYVSGGGGRVGFLDVERGGQLDLVQAVRSPGSTLKPLIYGLAFDAGIAQPATRVRDVPTRFGAYQPRNFEDRYLGMISLAEALRQSQNIPAVSLLAAIGPRRFLAELDERGTPLALPPGLAEPGLAIALGGVGTSLLDLVRLYRAMADDGAVSPLRLGCDTAAPMRPAAGIADTVTAGALAEPLLSRATRAQLQHILRSVPGPRFRAESPNRQLAYKTGTSYGFRDAWAIGFTPSHTVGVWVGRPDGAANPGHYGRSTAAPLLFAIVEGLPQARAPNRAASAPFQSWAALPQHLKFLGGNGQARDAFRRRGGPRILFPPSDATLAPGGSRLALNAEGGRPPYTWLLDGRPLATNVARATTRAPGEGFFQLTIVDAAGHRDSVQFAIFKPSWDTGLDRLATEAAGTAAPR